MRNPFKHIYRDFSEGRKIFMYWNCIYGYQVSIYKDQLYPNIRIYEGLGCNKNKFTAVRQALKNYKLRII